MQVRADNNKQSHMDSVVLVTIMPRGTLRFFSEAWLSIMRQGMIFAYFLNLTKLYVMQRRMLENKMMKAGVPDVVEVLHPLSDKPLVKGRNKIKIQQKTGLINGDVSRCFHLIAAGFFRGIHGHISRFQ